MGPRNHILNRRSGGFLSHIFNSWILVKHFESSVLDIPCECLLRLFLFRTTIHISVD